MTGHAVKGFSGFVPKDGETFNRRLNVRLHDDVVEQMEVIKGPADSLADVIRAALREYLLRETKRRESIINPGNGDVSA